MTKWLPITPAEPEGEGTVLIWCSRTNWVRTAKATAVVGSAPNSIEAEYHYTHFAYIDHPHSIPSYHPYYQLDYPEPISEATHITLVRTIGNCAETFVEFVQDEEARWFVGQMDATTKWMCDNPTTLLFKTKQEHLLAEIALARKRV